MKITAFYEKGGLDPSHEIMLVEKWCSAWRRIGWEPVILSEADAKRHPLYDRMARKADETPHRSDTFCHRMCFVRWLAFALVGGVVTDYDVFPLRRFEFHAPKGSLNGSLTLNPGFVFGSKAWMENYCQIILNYKIRPDDLSLGVPHVGDMGIMQRNRQAFDEVKDIVRIINEDDWRSAPLVHIANYRIRHRHQVVDALGL